MNIPANYEEFIVKGSILRYHYLRKKRSSPYTLLFICYIKTVENSNRIVQHIEYYKRVPKKGWESVTKKEFVKILYHISPFRLV